MIGVIISVTDFSCIFIATSYSITLYYLIAGNFRCTFKYFVFRTAQDSDVEPIAVE